MKTAIVHEWLVTYAGSERVVEQMLRLYPEADLFSLVEFLPEELKFLFSTSQLQLRFCKSCPLPIRAFATICR